ncbi:MAG: MFS transporter [Saprospiraceae bacterium]|nr:MFS transporter [Saprospiraceae bacterium]
MQERSLILFTLATVNFTHIVDSMLIMPLGDIFIELFGISAAEYSYLVSSYAIAAFISSLFGVFLLDRFDRKKALVFIYTGFAIGTLMCAFAESYLALLLLRFGTGLFGGMIGALVLSVVSDLYLFKERGAAMGILFAAFSAASALGVPIGIYLAAKGDWQTPFLIIGIIGLAISTFIMFKFPSMTAHFQAVEKKPSFTETISAITDDSNQVNALLAGFILVLAHFMIIPFISPYMIKNVGFTQMEISYQFFLGGLATVVSAPIVGRLTDKLGVMKVFTVVMIISFIPTMFITTMGQQPLWYGLIFTTMFFVFASSRMISPNTIISASAPTANRGSFMSIKSALQQFAIFLSAIISGAIVTIEEGVYQHYWYVGLLSVLFGIISIFLVKRLKVAKGN